MHSTIANHLSLPKRTPHCRGRSPERERGRRSSKGEGKGGGIGVPLPSPSCLFPSAIVINEPPRLIRAIARGLRNLDRFIRLPLPSPTLPPQTLPRTGDLLTCPLALFSFLPPILAGDIQKKKISSLTYYFATFFFVFFFLFLPERGILFLNFNRPDSSLFFFPFFLFFFFYIDLTLLPFRASLSRTRVRVRAHACADISASGDANWWQSEVRSKARARFVQGLSRVFVSARQRPDMYRARARGNPRASRVTGLEIECHSEKKRHNIPRVGWLFCSFSSRFPFRLPELLCAPRRATVFTTR
ncbi:hypothetical protein PUN28_005384 [Cardiocondyla obscurior]|uniref:Uncharacterized protein n=1 Tax=Cardiocondyla obscurior TaxID=286306 RepID=A0AAW2GK85_9HYME